MGVILIIRVRISFTEMHRKYQGESIYMAENDVHFPELALGETLSFAAEMKPQGHMSAREIGSITATLFGLGKSLHTQVGNEMIRGLSGGEKRRTSIAEAFLARCPIQCWDNSTRGLDSAKALNFVRKLHRATNALGSTVMTTIYQAPEAVYQEFDKVLLLYEGRQIYFGPAEKAAEYFIRLGFIRPPRATTADFLTSLTNAKERRVRPGFEAQVPRTPDEFAVAWRRSPEWQAIRKEVEEFDQLHSPLDRERDHPVIYQTTVAHQVRTCLGRAFVRSRHSVPGIVSGVIGNIILAIILGSVFYNLAEDTASFQARSILIFYATMMNACLPAFEVNTLWAQRPIVEKHTQYAFYHPVAEAIASMLADLPVKVVTSLFFNLCIYFLTNLRRSAAAFFIFWLFGFVVMVTMSMIFRSVGSLSRTYAQSLAPVAIMIFNFVIYAGFVIPPHSQVPWLSWIRWFNPIAYANESLMINEFGNRQFPCSITVPSGPSYSGGSMDGKVCSAIGGVQGESFVEGNRYLNVKYGYTLDHLWRNLGILFALMVAFFVVHLLAAEYIQAQKSKGDILLYRRKHIAHQPPEDEENAESSIQTKDITIHRPSPIQEPEVHMEGLAKQSSIFNWTGVGYDVKVGKEVRNILDEIDGWVAPGTVTALMGSTGAGKTTLLDVLASRKSIGIVRGDIHIDGRPLERSFQRKTGYVQQSDIHLSSATVREALQFSALLRQPRNRSIAQKLAYVDTVLRMLEMESYADAVVGVPGKGLNIEQRKRLTIAVEMAARPEFLLFLDEPTSGLDSQTAWSICTLLRKLADNGQAILCTIHQPSSELFQMFDRLLLLHEGKTAYFGDVGSSASTLIDYFERAGARSPEEGENTAEWLLDVANSAAALKWSDIWRASAERQAVQQQIARMRTDSDGVGATTTTGSIEDHDYASTSLQQLWLVTYRMFQDYWRDPTYLYSKIALCVGAALFNGLSFWLVSKDVQGLVSSLFSCFLLTIVFSSVDQQIIPRFIDNRAQFEAREQQSKTYNWVVFVGANVIVELVWQSLTSVLVFVAWYYPTGFWRNGLNDSSFTMDQRATLMFLLIWVFFLFSSTLSQAIAAGINDSLTAVNIANLLFTLCLLFCGILVQPDALARFWIFMYRVDPFTYLMDGMIVTALANTKLHCAAIDLLRIALPANTTSCGDYMSAYVSTAGGQVLNPDATTGECLFCSIGDTNVVLEGLGINVAHRWRDLGLMAVYVVFNVAATFFIYWLARLPKGIKNA
ncbi:P-loop containing nucleoside triphosphate hydrolase protein [Aspergillus caelatus]|uniref:P-loop containing nucleoside triphosphate hydrolase protein n=1 Tax=Aspergillus caelatus TaxID=61420 RepID=A0A5N6ZYZ1_9EURO|nr:P-loop containing nucleoside triphosphate hydrolase protein [Aspergillus caelatus]KAE8362635.1 P-loop containing nucleoside triphosphate hydrolase protein [Aspergillus caelatus]